MPRALLLLVCFVLALLAPSAATASPPHEPARVESSEPTRVSCMHRIASSIGSETAICSHAQSRPNPLVPPGALPRSRAGRRPSTNKGEAAGEAGWEGAPHHPLRLARADFTGTPNPSPPSVATTVLYRAKPVAFAYYELDLGGNIRRLRSPGGEDRGGYRYSAYGQTLEDSVQYVQRAARSARRRGHRRDYERG